LNELGTFEHFWRFILPLGRKNFENDFEYPAFRARRTIGFGENTGARFGKCKILVSSAYILIQLAEESAFILRRVELHHRKLMEGQSPYSIRQTAVYHSWNSNSAPNKAGGITILVAPSRTVESQLENCVEHGIVSQKTIASWKLYQLLVTDSIRGWMEYMAWLNEELRKLVQLRMFSSPILHITKIVMK
jgi:hypothetical protein